MYLQDVVEKKNSYTIWFFSGSYEKSQKKRFLTFSTYMKFYKNGSFDAQMIRFVFFNQEYPRAAQDYILLCSRGVTSVDGDRGKKQV